MFQIVANFCDWLSETHPSQVIQTVVWIIPTLQTIHILAIAMVMSSAILVDLRLLGLTGRSQPVTTLVARFHPWIWVSLLVLLATGALLVAAEPRRDLLNTVFLTKMALVIVAALLTLALQRQVQGSVGAARAPGGFLIAGAVTSLLLWTAIVGCGRWIAYVEHG
jgi:hypothetical protein